MAKTDRAGRLPLSVERITDAARVLIDQNGLSEFSMRRLGSSLDVEAMAIYKHVPDKEALLDLVVAGIFDEMSLPDPTDPWDDRLRHIAGELRRTAVAHPHLFQRLITQPPASPAVSQRIDATLSALRDGLGRRAHDRIAPAFWLFVNTTAGALLAETSAAINQPNPEALNAAITVECPVLTEFGPLLAACDVAEVFDQSVEMVLHAVI